MRYLPIALIFLAVCVSTQTTWGRYGDSYEQQTAQQKQDSLWDQIIQDLRPYGFYNPISALAGMKFEDISVTLTFIGDTFEETSSPRNKYIHTVGVVGKVKFVPVSNNEGYTGMLASGCDYGLIRLSAAKQPDPKSKAFNNFTPGFGLKFLRDGMMSANLVAMYGVNGQPSWNFFEYNFSNHIHDAEGLPLNIIANIFSSGTPKTNFVGLSDFSMTDQHGSAVSQPVFPYELVFTPTSQVSGLFPESYQDEFTKQLQTIPSGTTLYDVYARKEPGQDTVQIGQLILTSELTTSRFGDQRLFFKHQDMRDDLAIRPDWEPDTPSFKCPYITCL